MDEGLGAGWAAKTSRLCGLDYFMQLEEVEHVYSESGGVAALRLPGAFELCRKVDAVDGMT